MDEGTYFPRWEKRDKIKEKGVTDLERVYEENIKFRPTWDVFKEMGDVAVLLENGESPKIISHWKNGSSKTASPVHEEGNEMALFNEKHTIFAGNLTKRRDSLTPSPTSSLFSSSTGISSPSGEGRSPSPSFSGSSLFDAAF